MTQQFSAKNRKSRGSGCCAAILCSLTLLLAGCSETDEATKGPDGPPMDVATLRLGVVEDPAIGEAVRLLSGEWNAQTGCEVHVETMTLDEVTREESSAGDGPAVDALIGPSFLLGLLAERELVTAVPKDLMRDDSADWGEGFELPKLREAAWGTEVMGLTFGSPVLTVYCRADLLEKLGRRPPQTWKEYGKLAASLAELGEEQPWHGTLEPLSPGWAGLTLLARAAPYAKHPDNYSTLFDISTMEPLIAGPPFQWALEELVAVSEQNAEEMLRHDPSTIREAFWQGRCGMGLTWPTAAAEILDAKEIRIAIAELPGSDDVYDVGTQSKRRRADGEDRRVPLLAIAGRIGLVLKASPHREQAFQLLAWLSGKQFGSQVCSGSPATTLFRRSQKESPATWAESMMPLPDAAAYAEQTEATSLRQQWLIAPRIPGRDEYLAALDEAVRQAVRREATPEEALSKAADRWRAITESLGVERQKAAYRKSLGLP